MSFDEQKAQIESMINDGQKRVKAITTKYNNYINENKEISIELEQLVKKLKECTGNLGKIGEAYQRSKEETKNMEEDFAAKVQASEVEFAQRNKEVEERIQKQKQDLETKAEAQKQELETKIQQQHAADEERLTQQKKDNEEAMNELKKAQQEADVLAAQKIEQAQNDAAQSLEAQQKEATAKLMKQHEFDEEAKNNVMMQFEEFRTKAAQELEDLKNVSAAAKQTSDNAHKERLAQQKTHNDELLAERDKTHKAAIEKMKSEFDKSQQELKATLEGTQSTELEQANLKCQEERQNLVDQITVFQKSIKELTDNQEEEVKISLKGFNDTVTETCSKIKEIQDKIPAGAKEEEAPPQLKTEETPVGPQPPPVPSQEKMDEIRSKAKDVAERERIWAEAKKKIPTLTLMPNVDNSRMHPSWLFKDDRFAYEMCANQNLTLEQCDANKIKEENDRVINAFASFIQDVVARQNYEQHIKHAFIELALSMKKQNIHYDKDLHEIKIWLRMWFIKYMTAFPEKQQKIPTVEEHKKWYAENLQWQVDPAKYKSLEKGLANLGHPIKHSPDSHRHRRRSRSKSPPHKGGFRYGMKIPRRRTLRSKLKTQRLKSVKKNRKRKGKKSRKKRRRKKTAKNKK